VRTAPEGLPLSSRLRTGGAATAAESIEGPVPGPRRQTPRAGTAKRARWPAVIESLLLVLSPLLVVWPLRAQLWATTQWPDSYFHTAVIQHGRDLLERLGHDNRQFARAGFVVPGRLFNIAFGDIGGYLAFRYVLALVAIVPAYLLLRRLHGRAAGAVAVAVLLANPVVLKAWGSDYGDSSAVSYLVAGLCFLAMPAASGRRRLGWVAGAGAVLALAVHSNFITAPLVLAAVVAYAATGIRRGWRPLLLQVAVVAGAMLLTTGTLMALSAALFGVGDILSPTLHWYHLLRSATWKWHSRDPSWVWDTPHLLVPPAVLGAWVACSWRQRKRIGRAELVVAGTAALQLGACIYLQFFNTEQILEFYFYMSTLWASVCVLTAFVVVRVSRPLLDNRRTAWAPSVVVLLVPLLLHVARSGLMVSVKWSGIALVLVIVMAGAVATRWIHPPVAAAACITVTVACYGLTIGQDVATPWRAGQIGFPRADYANVIDTPDNREHDEYATASQLHHVVPAARHSGEWLVTWVAQRWRGAELRPTPTEPWMDVIKMAAGQYGYTIALMDGMPELNGAGLGLLRKDLRGRGVGEVMLLSPTGQEFAAARDTLTRQGFNPRLIRDADLASGQVRLSVEVLELTPTGRA